MYDTTIPLQGICTKNNKTEIYFLFSLVPFGPLNKADF